MQKKKSDEIEYTFEERNNKTEVRFFNCLLAIKLRLLYFYIDYL